MALLKKLSTSKIVISVIRRLHLSSIMKQIYYFLYAPKDKKSALSLGNIEIKLSVRNYEELRTVESFVDIDEAKIIESILNMLQEGDSAYDVGANIGIHTMFMSRKVGERGNVIAFEPEENNYEALLNNIGINNLKNILPVNTALGDTFDEGNLHRRKHIGIGAISLIKTDDSQSCQKVEIKPGDFLVQNLSLPIPKVVKIDVEGYEYAVLKGLSKTLSNESCKLLCCEIHRTLYPSGTTKEDIIDSIKILGFGNINTYLRGGEIHFVALKD
jgi:FkbM family methyltransferase